MTEIQIPDPDPEEDPEAGGRPAEAGPRVVGEEGADEGSGAPYRNLLVPLVVVPALIVMVLVLVYALFGAILGEESTPRENVQRLLQGGVNEREQAAFSLVRQFLEAHQGDEAPDWDLDAGLLPDIQRAHRASADVRAPGDVPPYLALTLLLVWLDDPEGVLHLAQLTALDEAQDPDGVFRSYAAYALGNFGEHYEAAEQRTAREALFRLIEGDDRALRVVSAGALQTLPGPETTAVLTGLLAQPDLDLRGTAALSLAQLGSDAGAGVLRELALGTEAYEAERAADPEGRRWMKALDISQSRQKALAALAHIDRLPPREELERLAEEDPDGEIRALARRLAADADAGP